jgi:predicted XRE-type DNA-binding protein
MQNIFLELGFPKHEAAVMLMRCDLAAKIRRWHSRSGMTQASAAKTLGISSPRLNEILRNHVEKVSVDYLLVLCAKAGISVTLKLVA